MVGLIQGKGGSLSDALRNNSPVAGVSLPDVAQPVRPSVFGSFAPSMSSASPPPVSPVSQGVTLTPFQQRILDTQLYGRNSGHETAANGYPPPQQAPRQQVAAPVQQWQPPQFSQAALLARQMNEEAMRRGRG